MLGIRTCLAIARPSADEVGRTLILWIMTPVKTIILILGGIALLGGGVFYFTKNNQPQPPISGPILFYSPDCPHCVNVEKFVEENNIEEKFPFTRLNILSGRANGELLMEKAKICGIPENQVGVPFLWNEGKCLLGDEPIINFFKEKTKNE